MKLWQVGLIIVLVGSLTNGLLVSFNIGGLVREGMRLVIIIGMGLLVFGLIKKK